MTDWFAVDAFVPHGFCLSWAPNLLATIVLSNALIALAYLVFSVVFVNQAIQPRPAVPRLLYWTFAAFIFCCGVSHVLDDVTLWLPIYRLQAVVLGVTAFVSLLTAVLPVSIWVRREADRSRRERG